MAVGLVKQQNIAVNRKRHLVFFEGTDVNYNYKTGQWGDNTAYTGLGVYSNSNKSTEIGLIRYSAGSVSVTTGFGVAQTAILTTGATDVAEGLRGVVNGVRPICNGGTHTVRIGVQDSVGGAVTWSTVTSVNSRTGMANFRSEGRYVRIEDTIAGGFTTAIGADVDFTPQGKV